MAKVTRALRHEATKFSMAFSKLPAPTPVEKTGLVADLEKACLALLAAFSELPLSRGLTLRGEVSGFVWEVLRAVQGMLSAVGASSSAGLQPVGTCWEKCDAIQRLSRDNKQAVTSILNGQYGIVQDAAEELDQTMRAEEEEAPVEQPVPVRNGFHQPRQSTWSLHDRQLLAPGLGLVKTARTTLRKVSSAVSSRGRCHTPEENGDLDRLAALASLSSAHVDDMVTALYPPVFDAAVRDNAGELKQHLLSILDATRQGHFYDSSEEWVDFLERAVEHNYGKLCNNTQANS
ncbi:cyclin-D1-binding protein 1 homolog isoform X2 [Ixodes scapularis]|nr:cyclin-D1-binding protein 1 homolog isoform X2 [Ixodes scapularis]